MGCVYRITNKKNGKSYVGLTVNSARERFEKHVSMINSKGCPALYAALEKYGVENFTVTTLMESDSKEELMRAESLYIKKLKTLAPDGYNMTTGGENCIVSDATRMKISKALTGRDVTWGDKVSRSVKKLWEDPVYREKQTTQRMEKRGKYRDGIKKPLRLDLSISEINKLHKDGMSIHKIAQRFGVSHSTIKKRIA